MSTFKEFSPEDIVSERDVLEQVVDFLQNDISSSLSRREYQVWVSGGIGPGITSSMFQTVFDQDFSLQTANPLFDITFGVSANSALVNTGSLVAIDTNTGKYYFSSQSVQMREKMDIYREFAGNLLGNVSSEFTIITGSTTETIREPLFLTFKRLFTRDRLKRETFAIRLFGSASSMSASATAGGEKIYTDVGSSTNIEQSYAGQVSVVVDSSNTAYPVGLLYLDKGILVLDTQRVFNTSSLITGEIDAMSTGGKTRLIIPTVAPSGCTINQLFVSASIDDSMNYVCSMLFGSGSLTSITYQNETFINSTIFFCRLPADYFNYSSNPTYVDGTGRMIIIDQGQEETQRSFSFITKVGLYDAYDNLLGVGSLSKPVYKARDRDFTLKVRLDFFGRKSRTYITKSKSLSKI